MINCEKQYISIHHHKGLFMLQEDKENTRTKISDSMMGGSYSSNMPQKGTVRNLTEKEIRMAKRGMFVVVLLLGLIAAACFYIYFCVLFGKF